MYNRASVMGICSLVKGFKGVTANSGTIMHPIVFITIPLPSITGFNGLSS
jgi:hypothetical protein